MNNSNPMKKNMNSLKCFNGRVRRKMTGVAAVAALLGMTAGALPSVSVSTAIGSGADAYVSGWATGAAGDSGSSNNSGLWCRKALTNENQVVAMRFDLSGSPRAGYSTFSIDLINYRTNASPKSLAFYAVRDGAVGEDNNGSTPGYTDNNWDENSILFSTMPGLHWANTSTTDQVPNADAIYLGTLPASLMVTNKGQINSFRSTALNNFMQTNADDYVTFLVVGADENEAGSNYLIRVSSKELTSLDGSAPAAAAGTFAPRVVYDPPASCVDPTILQSPASQTGNIGGTVLFTSWFGYDASTTFQWQLSTDNGATWANISGANSDRYTTPTLSGADTGKQYRCIATGCSTSVTNTAATLSVVGIDIWVGPASGGEWNTGSSWSLAAPPSGSLVTAVIGKSTNVNYNLPMAASFGRLTNSGSLTVNTNGFIINAGGSGIPLYLQTNAVLTIATNGVVIITNSGSPTMLSTGTAGSSSTINVLGGTLIVTNSGTFNMGEGASSDANVGAAFTNINGNVTISSQLAVKGRDSRLYMSGGTFNTPAGLNLNVTGNDLRQFFRFAGGTANLGNIAIARATTAGGVSVEGGVVNSSSIKIGNNIASGNSRMTGGVWTNAGQFYISDRNNAATSSDRRVYFTMSGGDLVTLGSEGIVINNQGQSSTANLTQNGGHLVINGGTITAEGVYLNGPSVTANSWARFQMSSGTLYLGTVGLVANANSGNSLTAEFTLTGGTLAAKNDWTSSADLPIGNNSMLTFKAADAADVAHNITLSGVISGASGSLLKTGAGVLTLNGANTYFGSTAIAAGTLALGSSGSLNNSSQIIVGSGTTFDVSQASGYTLPAAKSLVGFGAVAGNVNFASTATLNPGTNIITGTLTFSNSITQTGGAVNHFDLSTNPSGPNNDLVVVQGDINVSGISNIVEIVGGGTSGSVHPLFKYSGSLNGSLSSFAVVGPAGYLTNITTTTPKSISFVVTSVVRSATNIVWIGNVTTNYWDLLNATNWLNGGSLDYFVAGDTVTFNNSGLANPTVDITVPVQPASVLVAASGDYTFTGVGGIGGLGSITKTNTGKLIIQTTNNFTGGINIKQGTVSVSTLEPDSTPSPLGQTGTLLVDGGALEYTGPSTTWTRPLTMGATGGAVSLPSGVTLTYSGSISGSGSLAKNDLGSLTLSTANSHTGGTRVNAGTLTLNNVSGAGSGDITFTGNGTLALGAVKPANTIVLSNYSGVIAGGNSGGATGIKNVVGSSNLLINVTTGVFDLTGNMSAYSGTITFGNAGGGTIRLMGSTGSPLATWDLGSGPMDLNERSGSTSNNIGALKGGSSTTLTGRGGSGNSGSTTYYIGANGLTTVFDGIIQNGYGASGSTPSTGSPTSINKVGSGTLTLSGVSTHTGSTTISSGTLLVNGSLASGSAVTVAGGTLGGTGTIGGTTTVNSGAVLAAGVDTVGTLTFSGNLTLNAASTNLFAVTTSGGASNAVVVSGQLTPNGSVVRVISGSSLAIGTYPLFTYSTINGSFNATPVFDVAPAGGGQIVDNGSGQINLVISTGPSGPASLTNSISGNTLTLTWPAGENWRLEGQTNSLSSGLSPGGWRTMSGPGISDGSATITVDPNQPTVFYRLVYP